MADLKTPLKTVEFGERIKLDALMESESHLVANSDLAIDGNVTKRVFVQGANTTLSPAILRLDNTFDGTVEVIRYEDSPQHIVLDSTTAGRQIMYKGHLAFVHNIGFTTFSFRLVFWKALQRFVVMEGLSEGYAIELSTTENVSETIIVPDAFVDGRIECYKQDVNGFWLNYPASATTWMINGYNGLNNEMSMFFNETAKVRFYFK